MASRRANGRLNSIKENGEEIESMLNIDNCPSGLMISKAPTKTRLVVLADRKTVSIGTFDNQHHVQITLQDWHYFIRDNNNHHRVYVNSKKVSRHKQHQLFDNDNISIGNQVFTFHDDVDTGEGEGSEGEKGVGFTSRSTKDGRTGSGQQVDWLEVRKLAGISSMLNWMLLYLMWVSIFSLWLGINDTIKEAGNEAALISASTNIASIEGNADDSSDNDEDTSPAEPSPEVPGLVKRMFRRSEPPASTPVATSDDLTPPTNSTDSETDGKDEEETSVPLNADVKPHWIKKFATLKIGANVLILGLVCYMRWFARIAGSYTLTTDLIQINRLASGKSVLNFNKGS